MICGRVGRYRIADTIGAGAVGTVYRALDTRLGRNVALKFLHERLAGSERLRSRFRREALIGAALVHPNICTIHDLDSHEGRPFLVMELLRGKPLSAHLRRGPLPESRLLDLAIQLTDALAAAHRCGILHRDLKPSNVFLSEDGCVKLLDFGVAKPPDLVPAGGPEEDTHPGTGAAHARLVGTICYMSPEQARAEDLDFRSDLFSLGVLLYEAATGVHPFDAATTEGVLERLLHEQPESLRRRIPALSEELAAVILRLLHKSRDGRFQSADECARSLRVPMRSSG